MIENWFTQKIYSVSRLRQVQVPSLIKEGVQGWSYFIQSGNAITLTVQPTARWRTRRLLLSIRVLIFEISAPYTSFSSICKMSGRLFFRSIRTIKKFNHLWIIYHLDRFTFCPLLCISSWLPPCSYHQLTDSLIRNLLKGLMCPIIKVPSIGSKSNKMVSSLPLSKQRGE